MTPRARRITKTSTWLVLVLSAVLVTRMLRHDATQHYLATQRYEDIYYLPAPPMLKVLSLGFDEALADLLWLRALLYFADELQHRGEVTHLFDYTESLLALDPHFRAVYRWVATAALYRTGHITAADAMQAIDFLERGVRLFPDDGELIWDLGATYRFELVPLLDDADAIGQAKRRGLEHLEVAARLGAGPPWLVLSNAAQLEALGQAEQAIRHLEEIHASVREPGMRRAIGERLQHLRAQTYAEAFARAEEEWEQQRARDFPYIDSTLYLLVGSRPPFDAWAQRARRFDPLASRFSPPVEVPQPSALHPASRPTKLAADEPSGT